MIGSRQRTWRRAIGVVTAVVALAVISSVNGSGPGSGPGTQIGSTATPTVGSGDWQWVDGRSGQPTLALAADSYRLGFNRNQGQLTVWAGGGRFTVPLTSLIGRSQLPRGTRFLAAVDGSRLRLYVLDLAGRVYETAVLQARPTYFTVTFASQLGGDPLAAPTFFSNGSQGLPRSFLGHAFSPDPVSPELSPTPTTYLGVHHPFKTEPFAPPPFDLEFKVGSGWTGFGLVQVPDATSLTLSSNSGLVVNYPLQTLATFADRGAGGRVAAPTGGAGGDAGGRWLSFPTFVVTTAPTTAAGLNQYHVALTSLGEAPLAGGPGHWVGWWSWPMVDTWGQQMVSGAARTSPKYTAAWVMNFARTWRQRFQLRHATIVIDSQWQARLGHASPSARFGGWTGMRNLISHLHAEGDRVLLWWNLWVQQLPGHRRTVYDPTSPGFQAQLTSQMQRLLGTGPGDLGANGLKLDWGYLVPNPATAHLARPWLGMGAALLLRYMRELSTAAWRANRAALIDASAVAPQFGSTVDTLRLYDAHLASTWSYRAAIVSAVDPGAAIDGDGWRLEASQAVEHIVSSAVFGIPAIYYVTDWSGNAPIRPGLARAIGSLLAASEGRGRGSAVPVPGGWEYIVNNRISASTLADEHAVALFHYEAGGACGTATVVSVVRAQIPLPGCLGSRPVQLEAPGGHRLPLGRRHTFEARPGVRYLVRFAADHARPEGGGHPRSVTTDGPLQPAAY